MSNAAKMKVVQCNEKEKTPGVFITKVQDLKKIKDPIMGEKEVKKHYYFKGTIQHKEGAELPIDLSNYNVVEHPGINPETGDAIMLKWLHVK